MNLDAYKYRDLQLRFATEAVSDLLNGDLLYWDPFGAVRELIQNSIDACRVRAELAMRPEVNDRDYSPAITVTLDAENESVSIKDNGVGMTADTIVNYLLTIGRSYYASLEFAQENFTFDPLSRLGIGFLSCFWLSDRVRLKTRHFRDTRRHDLEFRKEGAYTSMHTVNDGSFEGTEVILKYDQFMRGIESPRKLEDFLRSSFLSHGVDLCMRVSRIEEIAIVGTAAADLNLDVDALDLSIKEMRHHGNIDAFVHFVRPYMRGLSNRDLAKFDEKYIKVLLLALFRLAGYFVVRTEVETESGYIDILLTKKIQNEEAVIYEWLIELKYVRIKDRHTVKSVRSDGIAQLSRYAISDQIAKSFVADRLRRVLLTFVGKDEICIDELRDDA